MPWPFHRRQAGDRDAPVAPHVAAAGTSDHAPVQQADRLPVVAPALPATAWAHLDGPRPASGALHLTFAGREFGRTLASSRPMAAPAIPPMHHRASPAAAAGVARDIASRATIVRREPHGDVERHHHHGDVPPDSPATRSAVGLGPQRRGSIGVAPLTHRRLPSTPTAAHRDLLRADVAAPFPRFTPGRETAGDDGGADVAPMSWEPERGFSAPAGTGPGMRVRRRAPHAAPHGDDRGAAAEVETNDDDPDGDREASGTTDAAALRYVPAPGPRIERPPADLVDIVRQTTGVDVGGARVDRSASVSERAAAMGAVAFTEDGTVHLPAGLGNDRAARAVLAHELTHVAQQRRAGSTLPREDSPEGAAHEAEAHAVQRAVHLGAPVRPLFLRGASSVPAAPAGVQRLRDDDDPYAWQEREAPPSQGGARAVFGFGFLRVDPDSEEGRAEAGGDREWARRWEADHVATLQVDRDRRYAEMVEQAERELDIVNLREERSGDDLIHLERRDILDLRRRLDDEMPYEFGPHEVDMYPDDPPLPSEDEDRSANLAARGTRRTLSPAASSASAVTRSDDHVGLAPDAATTGRTSATRQTPALRHRGTGRLGGAGVGEEADTSWQHRPATTREQISAVFGGALGGLLSGAVSDADDEAEQRQAEQSGTAMRRRREHERELRHVQLRELAVAARRNEEPGPVQLDDAEIAAIRAAVDTEMPLEFAMPEYLDRDEDVSMDAAGNIGPRRDDLDEEAGEDAAATTTTDDGTAADAESAESPGEVAGGVSAVADSTHLADAASPRGLQGEQPRRDLADTTTATAPDTASGAGAAAAVAPLASTAANALLDGEGEERDDETLARHVFAAASDLDLEHLARKLYGRFRRDLRRELLIDRERAGTLADAC